MACPVSGCLNLIYFVCVLDVFERYSLFTEFFHEDGVALVVVPHLCQCHGPLQNTNPLSECCGRGGDMGHPRRVQPRRPEYRLPPATLAARPQPRDNFTRALTLASASISTILILSISSSVSLRPRSAA